MPDTLDEFDYIARGQLALQQGNWFAALANFDRALDDNPNFAPAWYYRGMANRRAGNLSQAIADYTAAIAAEPDYPVAFYARGVAHRELEDYPQARQDYDRAIELEPEDADFYYARGIVHAHLRDYAAAIADFQECVSLNPANANAYYNLGRAYWQTQQWKEGLKSYYAALDIDPYHPSTRYFLGNMNLADGLPCSAQLEYDKALIAVPESADIWYNRGIALTHQCAEVIEIGLQRHLPRLSADAINSFNRALQYGKDTPHLYLNRGIAHNYAREYSDALMDLNRALEWDDRLAIGYRVRSNVHWELGNPIAAAADLDRYREMTGHDPAMDDYDY